MKTFLDYDVSIKLSDSAKVRKLVEKRLFLLQVMLERSGSVWCL